MVLQKVRLYDASADVVKGQFAHRGPVLDCCFHDDSSGFSASADRIVRRFARRALIFLSAMLVSGFSLLNGRLFKLLF